MFNEFTTYQLKHNFKKTVIVDKMYVPERIE